MGRWRGRGVLVTAVVVGLGLAGCGPSGPPVGVAWHFETVDGAGGTGGRLDADLGTDTAVVREAGGTDVFYLDATNGDLRRGWQPTGGSWTLETLDGHGGTDGRVDADVGQFATAALLGGVPHVWYYDATNGNLRHAYWTGTAWRFSVTDGAGGDGGRVDADVGLYARVIVLNGIPHVFSYNADAGTLRHSWYAGGAWHAETLDGAGGTAGRTGNAVGQDIAVTDYNGNLQVFYYDMTGGNQRHAWYAGGSWHFETLDGASGSSGRITADSGQFNAATTVDGTLHAYSFDPTDGDLRHAWYAGGGWNFETLDGNSTALGRTTNVTGTDVTALDLNGRPDLWYSDETGGALRHAWYGGGAWHYENLDGLGGTAGQVNAVVGQFTSGVTDASGRVELWYFADAGDLRHTWLR